MSAKRRIANKALPGNNPSKLLELTSAGGAASGLLLCANAVLTLVGCSLVAFTTVSVLTLELPLAGVRSFGNWEVELLCVLTRSTAAACDGDASMREGVSNVPPGKICLTAELDT